MKDTLSPNSLLIRLYYKCSSNCVLLGVETGRGDRGVEAIGCLYQPQGVDIACGEGLSEFVFIV